MTAFTIGQRVRTTVHSPAPWPGAPEAPAGSLGTVVGRPGPFGDRYGVALDIDPEMPAGFDPDGIRPA